VRINDYSNAPEASTDSSNSSKSNNEGQQPHVNKLAIREKIIDEIKEEPAVDDDDDHVEGIKKEKTIITTIETTTTTTKNYDDLYNGQSKPPPPIFQEEAISSNRHQQNNEDVLVRTVSVNRTSQRIVKEEINDDYGIETEPNKHGTEEVTSITTTTQKHLMTPPLNLGGDKGSPDSGNYEEWRGLSPRTLSRINNLKIVMEGNEPGKNL
jgi:hypothetical protein